MRLAESVAFYVMQGQPVVVPHAPTHGMVRLYADSGEFLGAGEVLDDGRVAPRRLINRD
ncbi:tRNA pseudouridine synthase B [compost metagenome]